MLTISIADSLKGPAALAGWGYSDAEAVAAAEIWQQQLAVSEWSLDSQIAETELAISELQDAWKLGPQHDSSLWGTWPADCGFQVPESVSSLSLEAAAAAGYRAGIAATAKAAVVKAAPTKQAAWSSPLRVPLPAPLAVESSSTLELGPEFEALELPMEIALPENLHPREELQPQKISTPAGLLQMRSGPGAILTAATLPPPRPLAPAAAPAPAPPGMAISPGEVGGRACTHVDWKIDDFRGKLQASMGRPVVSPEFAASGLSNLRLMVFPDARDVVKSARSHERKGLYTAMVKKGPLYGSLKLKADGLERATVITFSLLVGNVRVGPCTYDFSEQAVLGVEDFGINWLEEIEKASGALRVGIEIIEVTRK